MCNIQSRAITVVQLIQLTQLTVMPSASTHSGSTGSGGACWLKDRASVEAAADVWHSTRYLSQPSQSKQYMYLAMV
jgi:hypothetical protein